MLHAFPSPKYAACERILVLTSVAQREIWRANGNVLKAEHALREALQIIETLKEGESR